MIRFFLEHGPECFCTIPTEVSFAVWLEAAFQTMAVKYGGEAKMPGDRTNFGHWIASGTVERVLLRMVGMEMIAEKFFPTQVPPGTLLN